MSRKMFYVSMLAVATLTPTLLFSATVCEGNNYQKALTYSALSPLEHRFLGLWLGSWRVSTWQAHANYGANSLRFNSDLQQIHTGKPTQLKRFEFTGITTQHYILNQSATYANTLTEPQFFTHNQKKYSFKNTEIGITRLYKKNHVKMWIFDGNGNQLICCGPISSLKNHQMLVAYTCGLKTKNLSNNNHTTREYETISMNATHTKGEMLDYKTAALKKSYQITHLEKLRSKSSNHDS